MTDSIGQHAAVEIYDGMVRKVEMVMRDTTSEEYHEKNPSDELGFLLLLTDLACLPKAALPSALCVV